jgi:hypothetical protein
MRIPDLRNHAEITLEHCHVLVHLFGQTMDQIEGTVNAFQGMSDGLDPSLLKDYYEQLFEPEAFQRLFSTEMGKGVLLGAFAQALMSQISEDMEGIDG